MLCCNSMLVSLGWTKLVIAFLYFNKVSVQSKMYSAFTGCIHLCTGVIGEFAKLQGSHCCTKIPFDSGCPCG